MGRIRVLDPHLVNKIAAGEVIERPASVVKELVENSLDAGAARIYVSIDQGGLAKITVSDDGEGMSREDLELAIRRHTTSKIATEEDLERISTLGFRGEALASIVEVSRTTITTRARGADEAVRLEVAGGKVISVEPSGRAPGTTVEVQELFYNTPARRKYLRGERTEGLHITRVMKRFILARPLVHFRLASDGRLVLEAPPQQDLRERVATLYGPEFARRLIEVQSGGNLVRVHGLVGPPEEARADRQDQFIIVNGRYVRDQGLNYALSRSYEGLVKSGRFPPAFIFIEISPELVDVNVHPRKEEVRFSDSQLVQAELRRALGAGLLSRQAVPRLEEVRPRPEASRRGRLDLRQPRAGQPVGLDLKRELAALRPRGPEPLLEPEECKPSWKILGQLHNTYILVQTEEGLELIDQHVAHEQVLYERFMAQLRAGQIPRQRLLIPLTIELSPDEAELLTPWIDRLSERLGIGLEAFGGGSFILREWPQVLAERLTKESAREALQKILRLLEAGDEPEFAELVEQVASELACAAAIVKNTALSLEEMEELVRNLQRLENPYRCPHGRPIIVKYTLEDLERSFGRR
ncbi:MAG: DNA mismatch repair endonuclease MutL [Candidatus Acetothermia bacterium]|jgi:DNA mismatch repair protein MutL|nr:DNA mismatch repair endonuclease MutL [Candidatus Acetothermia bacterium]MDH7504693.1 DNA mismatch repair endonuclease MutL [Candidatus Acetothermia bacterium]